MRPSVSTVDGRAIHKRRSATHQWRSRLSLQMLLQKYQKCNICLLIMDSPGELPPHDLHFCRAMLCKRGLCLSVCPSASVTFVNHVKTNKHIIKIFSPSGSHSHAILVFFTPNGIAIFRREPPLTGASNAGGVGRNRDSEPIWLDCLS